jgi:hypothetical protein
VDRLRTDLLAELPRAAGYVDQLVEWALTRTSSPH